MHNIINTYREFETKLADLGPLLPLGITKDCHLVRASQEIEQYKKLLSQVKAIHREPGVRVLSLIQSLEHDLDKVLVQ